MRVKGASQGVACRNRSSCAGAAPQERQGRPRNDETMWSGEDVDLGDGKTLRSRMWPKVYLPPLPPRRLC